MTDQIKWAIARFTKHARSFADIKTDNSQDQAMTEADRAAHASMVSQVCDEMDKLADRPDATFLDFEDLLNRSESFPAAPLDFVSGVADAFLAAGRLS